MAVNGNCRFTPCVSQGYNPRLGVGWAIAASSLCPSGQTGGGEESPGFTGQGAR